jgi:predicted acylesterase/phospholipase RssA
MVLEAPRRSLILAGGGMRVAYQAGVLRALEEHNIHFAHMDGTSGGTINLAMRLSGLTPTEMCNRWRTLNVKRFVSLPPLRDLARFMSAPGWGDADGIQQDVFPHLGIDIEKINAATDIIGTFNVCNFSKKTVEVIPHQELDLPLLTAGISLPIFMPAIKRGDDWYTDAVWIKDANLTEAVRQGAEEIWVVWCIGNTSEYQNGAFQQYVHMIEMSANGALFAEFDYINAINARILAGETVDGRTRPITVHLIKPESPLPLDPDFYFGKITAEQLIGMGYSDALQYLKTMSPTGIPLTPDATRMTTTRPGVTFKETMAGSFMLGITDPQAIENAEAKSKQRLAMHVTVTIPDVQRFVDDPNHPGALEGHIEFPPFGEKIPSTHGVFNLFAPTNDPNLTYMVYELGFTHEGKSYYLAGHKEVRNDPGLDLWSDTTTLYTTLHEGTDKSGKVVGAGILRLGMTDFLKLMSTMRAINATTAREQTAAVTKFGRFFLRELWETYGPRDLV